MLPFLIHGFCFLGFVSGWEGNEVWWWRIREKLVEEKQIKTHYVKKN